MHVFVDDHLDFYRTSHNPAEVSEAVLSLCYHPPKDTTLVNRDSDV
jgi:hypothetical protein